MIQFPLSLNHGHVVGGRGGAQSAPPGDRDDDSVTGRGVEDTDAEEG